MVMWLLRRVLKVLYRVCEWLRMDLWLLRRVLEVVYRVCEWLRMVL